MDNNDIINSPQAYISIVGQYGEARRDNEHMPLKKYNYHD